MLFLNKECTIPISKQQITNRNFGGILSCFLFSVFTLLCDITKMHPLREGKTRREEVS